SIDALRAKCRTVEVTDCAYIRIRSFGRMLPEVKLTMRSVRSLQWLAGLVITGLIFHSAMALTQAPAALQLFPGMPPVIDSKNLYSESVAGKFSPAVAGVLPRVYVPHVK